MAAASARRTYSGSAATHAVRCGGARQGGRDADCPQEARARWWHRPHDAHYPRGRGRRHSFSCGRPGRGSARQPGQRPIDLPAESAASVTFRVYATREGLVGGTTSSGHTITANDHFVALPSTKALNKTVKITYKGKSAIAPVLDIGPWNNDDDYWNPSDARVYKGIPRGKSQAQAAYENGNNGGKSGTGLTVTAPGGIDIGDGTYADLGLGNADWVDVTFLWLTDDGGAASASERPCAAARPGAESGSARSKSGLDLSALPVLGVSDSPPLDRASDLGTGYTFVPQTGHNMPDVIAKYWNAKGGVPSLGYPLSELFVRKANGEQHVYQYFERVLVEYLPDSNSVALAPLGSWFGGGERPVRYRRRVRQHDQEALRRRDAAQHRRRHPPVVCRERRQRHVRRADQRGSCPTPPTTAAT